MNISIQYQEQSPTISSFTMVKKLSHSSRVQDPLEFVSVPKRKRGDSIDVISASRDVISASRQQDNDDDFVYPAYKRSNSSTRPLSAFCTASYDLERRDGPADDVHDDDEETDALVKKFRTSIFRQEEQPSSQPFTISPHPYSPIAKEDEGNDFFDLPSIQRATTICDDLGSDNSCCEPPEISSRSTSPQEYGEELDDDHQDWSTSYLSLECNRHEEKYPILEERRERPAWLSSSPSSSVGQSQPSTLWNTSEKKESFWPESWTGSFHLGSA
eukprot:CAMPEP_0202032620 /NCGR_PEP_ID=MMETSP0905-20130828/65621_1 /ASSEMBLY_ACC=CAM_ASM_000554 /TAXON_ID=420261 /ORGANISM="Thalassiosira antarctica, Strain CCMP982" /LENGTH=271 /DNA_ID=CAMNT_0048596487 /DNA_START=27 /DNA_END=842 /DNA_ORIENTATION=-